MLPGGIGLHGELLSGAAAESDPEGDVLVACDGDIVDEESGDAGSLAMGGFGVVPESGEVGGEVEDALSLGGVELAPVVFLSAFEFFESELMFEESLVPVGFELSSDEAVVGVGAEEASACEVGVLGGALDAAFPEGVDLVGAGVEFVVDAESGFEAEGGDELDEELSDGAVDVLPGDGLAGWGGGFGAAAEVSGEELSGACLVSDDHAAAADAAEDEPLQESGPLARGALAVGAEGGGGAGEPLLVGLELLPGEISGVGVPDEGHPFLAGSRAGRAAARASAVLGASVGVGAGVARVPEGAEDAGALQRLPEQFPALRTLMGTAGEEQVLIAEEADDGARRP